MSKKTLKNVPETHLETFIDRSVLLDLSIDLKDTVGFSQCQQLKHPTSPPLGPAMWHNEFGGGTCVRITYAKPVQVKGAYRRFVDETMTVLFVLT